MFWNKSFSLNFCLIVLFHLAFFVIQISIGETHLWDSKQYLWLGKNISEGLIYSEDPSTPLVIEFFSLRPPVYGVFILITQVLTGSEIPLLLAQNILSILNFIIILKMLEEEGKEIPFHFLLVILIFMPSQFIYANLVMAEILLQTFLVLSFLFYYKYFKTQRGKYLFFSSGMLILGVLTKPVVLVFLVAFLILIAYESYLKKNFRLLIPAIIPFVVVLLYSWFNYSRTGYFHYSSITSVNLLHYNGFYLLKKVKGNEKAEEQIESLDMIADTLSFPERQRFIKDTMTSIIMDHPVDYAALHFKGSLNFIIDPGRFDLYKLFGLKEPATGLAEIFAAEGYKGILKNVIKLNPLILIYMFGVLCLNIIFLISFVYYLLIYKSHLKWFILFMVLAFVFATGIIGASRFKVPLLPFLVYTLFLVKNYIPILKKI